jgi:hypothetical protein
MSNSITHCIRPASFEQHQEIPCGKPTFSPFTWCRECRDMIADKQAVLDAERRNTGVCWCYECNPEDQNHRMFVCPICGNKRCPLAASHLEICSFSSKSGQEGSLYSKDQLPPEESTQPKIELIPTQLPEVVSRSENPYDVIKDDGVRLLVRLHPICNLERKSTQERQWASWVQEREAVAVDASAVENLSSDWLRWLVRMTMVARRLDPKHEFVIVGASKHFLDIEEYIYGKEKAEDAKIPLIHVEHLDSSWM